MSPATGMSRTTGSAITQADHIRQSVADILTTPLGTRVMREDYGSLVPELIDHPQTKAMDLRLAAASFMAILRWEPRIKPTKLSVGVSSIDGRRTIDIQATGADVQNLAVQIPLGATA